MTPRDDRFPNMLPSAQFDSAIEQVLGGDAVGDDAAPLARFVDDLRVMADRPPPRPSPELAALLAGSGAEREARATVVTLRLRRPGRVQARSTRPSSRRSPAAMRMRVAALGLAGKAAMLLAFATTAVAGAATGLLPQPATHFLRRAVEVVTPFELPAGSTGDGALAENNTGAAAGDEAAAASPSGPGPNPAAVGDLGAIRTLDVERLADGTAPPSLVGDTWTAVDGYAESGDTAQAAAPTPPTSSPTVGDPAEAPSPSGDHPLTHPAPGGSGHVPPGSAPPGGPQLDGSDSVDTPLMHPGGTQHPPPAPKHPPAEAGSAGGPPSEPNGQGSHDGRPAGPAPVQDPPGEVSPSEPGQVPGLGPSQAGGSDHAPCGPCDPSGAAPHHPDDGPGGRAPAATSGGRPES
jgi:hypothetical protein